MHSFYSSSSPSGENRVVELQVDALRRAGVECEVFALRTDDLSASRGYELRAALRTASGHGASPVDALRVFAPDVTHVHNTFPNWSTRWLQSWDGPLVATLHNFRAVCAAGTLFRDGGSCEECPSLGSQRAVVHACYRGSAFRTLPLAVGVSRGVRHSPLLSAPDLLVALAPRTKSMFERFGVPGSRMVVIPNFSEPPPPAEHEVLGHWVFVGRLSPEKGIAELIRSWPTGQSLHVLGDGPIRHELEAAADRRPEIQFAGYLEPDALAERMVSAQGLIFPSIWPESAPSMVYVEALSMGLPTVALSGSAVGDDVELGGTGLVVDGLEELSTALDEVAMRRDELSARAMARSSAEFTADVWTVRMLEAYAEAIRRRSSA